ncbi:cysteine synthase A [Saccharibacillus sp. CPCC 101409]|uniref:cysteine synthase A n=1 Tax=Saccharibacillus sp. CPCC 101409 TaxID=3058041 RepID=UPI00267101D9|nr:cysteine synthase A [Saccharibacillus sp. CPCC 101409]MDO3409421.1 cysteine synthase A [Saccharibacillus sp. CPCC 101409]
MTARKANHITDLIGQTPVVRLNRLVGDNDADIYVKLEYFNPGGSLKDRAAYNMIVQAEKSGRLRPGSTIIEPTSGNTGIGLAMTAAAKGYRLIIVMPSNMSKERVNVLRSYGAEVVFTPAAKRMPGAIRKALALQRQTPYSFVPQQFENPANPEIHKETTGPEIYEQMEGRVDAFVSTAGTGGTVTGAGEYLRGKLPGLHIAVIEPEGSPVLSGGQPGPHKLIGAGPGFVPAVLNPRIYDEIIRVSDENALVTAQQMASQEGILVGPSSGAAVWASLQIAKRLGPGKSIVCVAPDSGERYASLNLFDEEE